MLPTIQKQPDEQTVMGFEFVQKLAFGDALTGTPTMTVSPSGELTATSPRTIGTQAVARLAGGTNPNDYTVTCSVGTTGVPHTNIRAGETDILDTTSGLSARDGMLSASFGFTFSAGAPIGDTLILGAIIEVRT